MSFTDCGWYGQNPRQTHLVRASALKGRCNDEAAVQLEYKKLQIHAAFRERLAITKIYRLPGFRKTRFAMLG
jgi:hypothetical protein